MYNKIRRLQQELPTIEASNSVNTYLDWSQGYYGGLLASKPLTFLSKDAQNIAIPVVVRAGSGLFERFVKSNIANLISAVRENMNKKKEEEYKDERKRSQ